jgi:hypothetical protein
MNVSADWPGNAGMRKYVADLAKKYGVEPKGDDKKDK